MCCVKKENFFVDRKKCLKEGVNFGIDYYCGTKGDWDANPPVRNINEFISKYPGRDATVCYNKIRGRRGRLGGSPIDNCQRHLKNKEKIGSKSAAWIKHHLKRPYLLAKMYTLPMNEWPDFFVSDVMAGIMHPVR